MDSVMVDMVHTQATEGWLPPGGRPPPAVTERPHRQTPGQRAGAPPRHRPRPGPSEGQVAGISPPSRRSSKPGALHDGNAQLLGLFELGRTGIGAHHDGPRPGRHAPRRLSPPGQDGFFGLLPGVARDGPGDHDRATLECLEELVSDHPVSTTGTFRTTDTGDLTRPSHPSCPGCDPRPGLDQGHPGRRSLSMTRRLASDATNSTTLSAMTGPIPSTAASSASSATDQRVERPVATRQGPAPGGPEVADPEPDEEPAQGAGLRGLDRSQQVVDRQVTEALERDEPLGTECIDVAGVGQQAGFDELDDTLLTQPLDVERAPRREVDDALDPLGGTVDVRAEGVALAGKTHERSTAARALLREVPRTRPLGPVRQHRPDHLGDDVARLAHHHGVTGTDVFQADLVLVVQGGEPDGRSSHEHRLEHGERRGPAGPPDRHHDAQQLGGPFLGRELEGDGPTRRPRCRPQPALQFQVVDLDDHTVDLVVEVVSVLFPVPAEGLGIGGAAHHRRRGGPRGDRTARNNSSPSL